MDEEKLFRFHFTYSEIDKKSSCRHCTSKLKGKNISNLKRHVEKKHPERAQETNLKTNKRSTTTVSTIQEPPQKVQKLTRGELIQSCVELVTMNLVPYHLFSFTPFKRIVEIHQFHSKVAINPQAVQKYVAECSNRMKKAIQEEIKNKMISLKLDVATRLGRSMLGVNIQFYSMEHHKIVIRSIGMIELMTRHTASNISIMISDLLRSYDIDQRSIISITCDNGANIVASAKIFQEHQNSLLLGDQIDDMNEDLEEFYNDTTDEEEFDSNGPLDLPNHIKEAIDGIETLAILIRCSIHTLQLSVHDSLKEIKQSFGNELKDIRKVIKNLSSSVYIEHVKSLNLHIPCLDVCTRWNSSYNMVHKLIVVKEKLQELYEHYESSDLEAIMLNDHHWEFMNKFNKAFKPCYELTMKLQNVQTGIADFYFLWRKCLYQLKNDSVTNEFSIIIAEKMNIRSDSIYANNDALLSALYIDPRYNYMGKVWNDDLKTRAEAYLLKIHKQIENFNGPTLAQQTQASSSLTDFDLYLNDDQVQNTSGSLRSADSVTLEKIMKCCVQPRISASVDDFSIFEFLKAKYSYDKNMLDTCLAVAATPSNQASVERSFSALRILLTHIRCNLLPKSIEDIMMCHLNSALFLKINFETL